MRKLTCMDLKLTYLLSWYKYMKISLNPILLALIIFVIFLLQGMKSIHTLQKDGVCPNVRTSFHSSTFSGNRVPDLPFSPKPPNNNNRHN